MIDELFDRNYQDGRAELNAGLDRAFSRLAHSTGTIFRVLHRIEFDAPWKNHDRRTGRA